MTTENIELEGINECPECKCKELIKDSTRGDVICSKCGLVVEEKEIDHGPEWRAFDAEQEKRRRTGSPMTYTVHDKGLSTIISWDNRDSYGNKISAKMKAQVFRLRKWQTRTRVHSSIDRNLAIAMSELDRLSSQLNIPRGIKESTAVIYRNATEEKLIRGQSIEAMIAAALYCACRIRHVPRTLDEVGQRSYVSKKEIGRCYRILVKELRLKVPLASPIDYIPRFTNELGLSGHTLKRANEIIQQAKEKGLTIGKDPTGLAASSIYISSILEGERRTQREIAEIAHVTEVTVRNRYKELVQELNINIEI
ncbi:MAG: transcription initiation factor IIB [Candidatus Lokiarchaeota archaeon]|nr:transcription initiation factor IIB [Candidatus Lokiarchaeota archaeon]